MKKTLFNESISAQPTKDGGILINNQKHRLEVYKLGGWIKVNINKVAPTNDGGWEVTASKLGTTQTDIVPSEIISKINKNIGQPIIELGGKVAKRLVKENKMEKIIQLTEQDLTKIVRKVLKEQEQANYMFFSNLEQIKRQCEMLLNMDKSMLDDIILNGHDWADDHITEAKVNLDQVFDFIMNEKNKKEQYVDFEPVNEGKKKVGTKLCSRGKSAAKSKFKVYPSAYANGYAVQVCKGKMPGLDGKKRCSPPYC